MILFLKLLNVIQNMISILYGGALSLVTHMTAVSVVLFFFFCQFLFLLCDLLKLLSNEKYWWAVYILLTKPIYFPLSCGGF